MVECAILLEACHPGKKIFRSYYIAASYDLFGELMVEVTHGQIGAKGKRKFFYMESKQEARLFICELLKRRENATSRQQGVPYRLRYRTGRWDMDEALFPFRQSLLFEDGFALPVKKQRPPKTTIQEGEGLFSYSLRMPVGASAALSF